MTLGSGLNEAADRALLHPKSTLALAIMGLVAALVSVFADATAGAVVLAGLLTALVGGFLFALYQRTQYDGPYQLLHHASVWELENPDGSSGCHTKRNKVSFNYPSVVVQEQAWGDGQEHFEDYRAEHGELIATRTMGGREFAIILLEKVPARNERRTLVSHRRLINRFPSDKEWIQFEIPQRCPRLSMEVRFPGQRPPRDLQLISKTKRGEKARPVDGELEDVGNHKVFRLPDHNPKRVHLYMLTWRWDRPQRPGIPPAAGAAAGATETP